MPSALGKRPLVSSMTPRFPGMRVLILAVTFAVALFAHAAADSSSVGCGFSHTCAVLSTGVVRCWGDNQYGQLGDGLSASNSSLPSPAGRTQIGLDDHGCEVLALRAALQSTQVGKQRVAYPTVKRLLIHTSIAIDPSSNHEIL